MTKQSTIDIRFYDTHNDRKKYEYPTYRECRRCGIRIGPDAKHCPSCSAIIIAGRRDLPGSIRPDFDISIYTRGSSRFGTGQTVPKLRDAKVAYQSWNMYEDAAVLAYLHELTGHNPKSVVTISRPGELLDWWEGDNAEKVAEWIGKAQNAVALAA